MANYDELVYTRCPVPTATSIAADQGWITDEFAPDDIRVRSLQDTVDVADRETHFTHSNPALFREGGNVPALWAKARGERTRLIGLTWIEERQQILVSADSEIDSPARLRGARVAIPRHGYLSIDFWRAMALSGFAGALRVADLGLDQVDLVDIDVHSDHSDGQWGTELAALADGRVDAVYVKGAAAVEIAARYPVRTGIDLDAVPDRRARVNNGTPRPITVHEDLLEQRPDLVSRFLGLLNRAADWAAEHPDGLSRILAAETAAGATGVAAAYPGSDLRVDLSPERLELLAQQEAFLRRHDFLPQPVDIDQWIAVPDIEPEVVA